MKSKNQSSGKSSGRPAKRHSSEMRDKGKPAHERLDYPQGSEQEMQQNDNDTSYSEQVDVTPPTAHEVPSFGRAKTDFVSKPYGRRTGRMVGHEPGTENL
jgi:hypothetical protein